MIQLLEVSEWEMMGGLFYDTHLPKLFTAKIDKKEDLSGKYGFAFHLSDIKRPYGDGKHVYAAGHFFDHIDAGVHLVLEDSDVIIVHVVENPGRGHWRDAIFALKQNDKIWNGQLLLVGKGVMREGSGRRNQHNKFVILGLKNGKLEVKHLTFDREGKPEETKRSIAVTV